MSPKKNRHRQKWVLNKLLWIDPIFIKHGDVVDIFHTQISINVLFQEYKTEETNHLKLVFGI